MTVTQATQYLSAAFCALIGSATPLRKLPSVMLWGAPGVGKSQSVRQIAAQIEQRTGKKVCITDVRLMLFNPVDLRGIPTANAEKTLAVWLKPKIFQMDESEDTVNILFLDEISAAPQSVQAAAYQITLDRTIGEHRLPENCIVIAAGNRVTDRSVAYQMPKALANRLCHLEIAADHESWHQWALGSGIHPLVVGFLDFHPELLMDLDAREDDYAFPTPRSWEMVSNLLCHVSDNVPEIYPLIAGCVGSKAAYELWEWSEVSRNVPPVKEIFAGTHTGIPARPMVLFALISGIVAHAKGCGSAAELEPAIRYLARLPADFRTRALSDLLQIRDIRPFLKENATFCDWFDRTGKHWEDYGV